MFQFNPYWQISGVQTNFWKTHPIVNFGILGHDTGRLHHASIFYKNWIGTHKKWWMIFSSSCPGIWDFEKILDEFSRNRSVSRPGKISGWVFQDLPTRVEFTFVIFEVRNGRNSSTSPDASLFSLGRMRIKSGLNYAWALWPSGVHALKSLLRLDSGTVFFKKQFDLSIWAYYMPHISNIYYWNIWYSTDVYPVLLTIWKRHKISSHHMNFS